MSENQIRVMVIDDERIVGKRLRPALEKSGYEVETFEDAVAAMERFDREPFQIVVTDIRMDEMDGLEVLERVTDRAPDTKVVVITGYATVEM
ncbi:MAG: response regulator, partial [Deltaproteobacteria bacterium]|nr:response regulator [Deltaproteobacteria bacterium]